MVAKEIKNYAVNFYGGTDGYLNSRAQIALTDNLNNALAYIRFYDGNMPTTADMVQNGVIYMYLPSSSFANVLDILRNEKPLYIDFRQNRGFLMTEKEVVGEGESA